MIQMIQNEVVSTVNLHTIARCVHYVTLRLIESHSAEPCFTHTLLTSELLNVEMRCERLLTTFASSSMLKPFCVYVLFKTCFAATNSNQPAGNKFARRLEGGWHSIELFDGIEFSVRMIQFDVFCCAVLCCVLSCVLPVSRAAY